MYSFIAPTTGQMTITQSPGTGSAVASHVYVYGANQQLIWQNQSDFSMKSRITLGVTAGTEYYVEASGHSGTTGAYQLQFSTVATAFDTSGNGTFATATPLTLAADGSGSHVDTIYYVGNVDFYSITATFTGPLVFRETATSGSLSPEMSVFSSSQTLLGQAVGGTGSVPLERHRGLDVRG